MDDKLGALASSLPRSGKAAAKAPSYLYLVLVDHGSASAPDSLLPTVLFLNATDSGICSRKCTAKLISTPYTSL